jgi:hypothetical protein
MSRKTNIEFMNLINGCKLTEKELKNTICIKLEGSDLYGDFCGDTKLKKKISSHLESGEIYHGFVRTVIKSNDLFAKDETEMYSFLYINDTEEIECYMKNIFYLISYTSLNYSEEENYQYSDADADEFKIYLDFIKL